MSGLSSIQRTPSPTARNLGREETEEQAGEPLQDPGAFSVTTPPPPASAIPFPRTPSPDSAMSLEGREPLQDSRGFSVTTPPPPAGAIPFPGNKIGGIPISSPTAGNPLFFERNIGQMAAQPAAAAAAAAAAFPDEHVLGGGVIRDRIGQWLRRSVPFVNNRDSGAGGYPSVAPQPQSTSSNRKTLAGLVLPSMDGFPEGDRGLQGVGNRPSPPKAPTKKRTAAFRSVFGDRYPSKKRTAAFRSVFGDRYRLGVRNEPYFLAREQVLKEFEGQMPISNGRYKDVFLRGAVVTKVWKEPFFDAEVDLQEMTENSEMGRKRCEELGIPCAKTFVDPLVSHKFVMEYLPHSIGERFPFLLQGEQNQPSLMLPLDERGGSFAPCFLMSSLEREQVQPIVDRIAFSFVQAINDKLSADFRPGNWRISEDGEVKLIDWGVEDAQSDKAYHNLQCALFGPILGRPSWQQQFPQIAQVLVDGIERRLGRDHEFFKPFVKGVLV
jgi:hypothetical protein